MEGVRHSTLAPTLHPPLRDCPRGCRGISGAARGAQWENPSKRMVLPTLNGSNMQGLSGP